MGKNKLSRFRELETFQRVFQPPFEDVFRKDYIYKGKWAHEVFQNDYPIVLELGCGKGEYSIGLARLYPDKNFMGLDIKGARIWKGARTANEEEIQNVAFLRTRIELISSFFEKDEVEEIWITFPDPQEKRRRNKKRLTGAIYLNLYRQILKDGSMIHLKTDNDLLYADTLQLLEYNDLPIIRNTDNLYDTGWSDSALSIQTFYELRFLEAGKPINYLEFRLPTGKEIKALPDEGL